MHSCGKAQNKMETSIKLKLIYNKQILLYYTPFKNYEDCKA